MLVQKDKDFGQISIGRTRVAALYKWPVKIWEGIRSCFGSGKWRQDKPWNYKDKWKY